MYSAIVIEELKKKANPTKPIVQVESAVSPKKKTKNLERRADWPPDSAV